MMKNKQSANWRAIKMKNEFFFLFMSCQMWIQIEKGMLKKGWNCGKMEL
jgi:hypothetical protein